MTAEFVKNELFSVADEEKRIFLPRFFKTGKGQYGEGDKFMGIVVPMTRMVALQNKDLSFGQIDILLNDEYHECRLCALLILIAKFKKASENERKEIYDYYLAHTHRINNWDLVDLSCKEIVGEYLVDKDRDILYRLAKSSMLWEQRIAVVSTFAFIKRMDFIDILSISEKLLDHKHDLIHKAVGWMLRETGKKDEEVLCSFLDRYYREMPRTMLRYSIEKLSPEEKAFYMKKVI